MALFIIVALTNDAEGLLVCCAMLAAMAVLRVHTIVKLNDARRMEVAMLLPLIASALALLLKERSYGGAAMGLSQGPADRGVTTNLLSSRFNGKLVLLAYSEPPPSHFPLCNK